MWPTLDQQQLYAQYFSAGTFLTVWAVFLAWFAALLWRGRRL